MGCGCESAIVCPVCGKSFASRAHFPSAYLLDFGNFRVPVVGYFLFSSSGISYILFPRPKPNMQVPKKLFYSNSKVVI